MYFRIFLVFSIIINLVISLDSFDKTDVITVKNMDVLLSDHAEILKGRKSRWRNKRRPSKQIFYLADSDSYLAAADLEKKWLGSGTLSLSNFIEDLGLVERIQKSSSLLYTQFYFRDIAESAIQQPIPVSLCHSEVDGEGSSVSMQLVFFRSKGMFGGLGVDPKIQAMALTMSTGFNFEKSASFGMSIKCDIPKGEVGQLFLSYTRKLNYTPWSRTLLFDAESGDFEDLDKSYTEWPKQSSIIELGMGEWMCASSSRTELKCFGVKGLSLF